MLIITAVLMLLDMISTVIGFGFLGLHENNPVPGCIIMDSGLLAYAILYSLYVVEIISLIRRLGPYIELGFYDKDFLFDGIISF